MRGLRLVVGLLTVVSVGSPPRVDRAVAGRAMVLSPLAGLLIGGAAALVTAGAGRLRPDTAMLAAVLGIATVVALSGALHVDGLADTADGLGSRRGRESALAIMRTGDIGPFGVVTVVLVLSLDTAALAACVDAGLGWQAVLVATVTSRAILPWACREGVPAARSDGLGALVAGTVRPSLAAATTAAAALVGPLVLLPSGIRAAAAGLLAGTVAVGAGAVTVRWAVRRLGGLTGDVLGAAVETGLAAALLLLALLA